jgi:metal-dependent amidase/aminoacylase/carboxypeptidase family protein
MHYWRGNIELAVAVANELTKNAVAYAMPGPLRDGPAIALRLTVTDADELLIDVSDPLPEFPNFAAAVAGHTTGHGLWQAARLGATLIWFSNADTEGKTVRAMMTPGPVPA